MGKQSLGIVVVLVFVGIACSDSDNDSLLGAASGSGGPTANAGGVGPGSKGSGSTGSGSTGSGSTGSGSTGSGSTSSSGGGVGPGSSSSSSSSSGSSSDGGEASGDPDGGAGGRALFEALLPLFDTTCGGACHQQGGTGAPPYLGGNDPYTTIKTYQGMIAGTAAQSILLTKGQHEGPAPTDPLKTSITNWLTVEAAALVGTGPAMTPPITVATGPNTVDLSKLGVAGASLGFTASVAGDILTLNSLQITAPAATGVQAVYPVFYVNGSGGAQTENDDLSNVSQTIPAGTSAPLGTGLLILTGWASADTIQITFTKLVAASAASDAGLAGGCKALAAFTTNAVPAIKSNTCLNCHNTGGSGNAALDLSGLAATPADDATACAQALTRANPANPAQSDIILAPTGQVAMHPFKNASASFVTMMETWIQAEK